MNPSTSNKGKSYRFRELILLTLQAAGVQGLSMKREHKKLSQAVLDEQPLSDITGTRWGIVTRNEASRRDLSGGLDEAVREAELDGHDRAAVIWHRPSRDTSESFVLMTLDSFTRVLLEEQEHRA